MSWRRYASFYNRFFGRREKKRDKEAVIRQESYIKPSGPVGKKTENIPTHMRDGGEGEERAGEYLWRGRGPCLRRMRGQRVP